MGYGKKLSKSLIKYDQVSPPNKICVSYVKSNIGQISYIHLRNNDAHNVNQSSVVHIATISRQKGKTSLMQMYLKNAQLLNNMLESM